MAFGFTAGPFPVPRLPQKRWTKYNDFLDPPAHSEDAGILLSNFADRNYYYKEGKILPP